MKTESLIVLLFLIFPSVSWADCAGTVDFLEPSEIIEIQNDSGLQGIVEGYNILQDEILKLKETAGVFCNSNIKISTSTSEYDFGQLVGDTLKINVKLLNRIGTAKEDPELASLYKYAILGLIGYFETANNKNSFYLWWGAEAIAQIGIKSPLKKYNMEVLNELASEDPILAYGMGIYRVLTGKALRTKQPSNFEYKRATHPKPQEIVFILRRVGSLELAEDLTRLIVKYEYEEDLADFKDQPLP